MLINERVFLKNEINEGLNFLLYIYLYYLHLKKIYMYYFYKWRKKVNHANGKIQVNVNN